MFQGTLPMLTKGPFALFYGGEEILDQLSNGSPGKGVPILILSSALFQLFLYVLKKFQARGMKLYTQNLRKSLVENILNMYGIIIIVAISSISLIYIIIHHNSIKENKEVKESSKLVPTEILILYSLTMLCVLLPFLRNHALR